jgi:hypothetical protein
MMTSELGIPMPIVSEPPDPDPDPGVHFFHATCNCCVNATVASSLDSSPLALLFLLVRAIRLLMLRMPFEPQGDQMVAVVSTLSCLV